MQRLEATPSPTDQMEESPLGCYRALDLTDEKGFLCGRILADLGVDVVKVEPAGGEPARRAGPFYRDIPHPDRSLYWFAYNANKRSVTLNVETNDGRGLFKRLVRTADILIESFPPGHMDSIGLGYANLSQVNPGIIMTSITPFGQDGPWKDYKGADIVLWALSSYMYVTGDDDRPPVWISYPQSYLHAGLEAAAATLVALNYRGATGEGQWVDVSAQQALAIVSLQNQQYWTLAGFNPRRAGASQHRSGVKRAYQRRLWQCKDGFVAFILFSGHLGAQGNRALTEWMDREGLAPEHMKRIDWATFDPQSEGLTEQEYDQMMDALGTFFGRHTKAELYQEAARSRIPVYPCSTVEDLVKDPQLEARQFWTQVEHPELDDTLTYPRPCMAFSEARCQIRSRAPLVGEHNEEVYLGELGLSGEELLSLKQGGIV